MRTKKSCDSCLMPFNKDLGKRESDIYCSFCFKNGEFLYKGDSLKEFKQLCYQGMKERNINKYVSKLYCFMIGFAPRWKKHNDRV
ncbi:MAG: zinc ribbon domain-containing protein [Bdellovibrionales bacterium]|nr:zinc ribbon domain-containing protein [Bdellovibrionales bacterium]